ncbi:MAG: Mut7-C RNAse domain-containing protein [bacterium JZ-2024 1]
MKFLVDRNLGSLAKWLRLLGFDVMYPEPMEDRALLLLSRKEGRILLTKDRKLAESEKSLTYYVRGHTLDEQVNEVLHSFNLKNHTEPLSRCSECNTPIRPVDKKSLRGKVPPKVYETQEEFWQCPGCGKIYWQGTHWERMKERIHLWRNSGTIQKGEEEEK